MSQPAILLDRDGVINVNRPDHVKSWDEFVFLPGVLTALSALSQLGLPILVISNQAVVQRGIVSSALLDSIHQRMIAAVQSAGARIDEVFYCPHDPSECCSCRKPQPGMLLNAAKRFDLDLSRSVLVGDAHTDIQAGVRANCKTILVLTGRGRESAKLLHSNPSLRPDEIVSDLQRAVPVIGRLLVGESMDRTPLTIPFAPASAAMD